MILTAVTALLCATEPSGTAMVLARRTNVSTADASALALSASTILRDLEVPVTLDADASTMKLAKLGLQDPGTCAGRRSCIVELGGLLGVAWVIGVSVSQIDADRSIALELIRVSDQAVVAKDAIILPGRTKLSGVLLSDFAVRCRAALKKPVVEDAPVAVKVVPEKPRPPPAVAPPPPAVESRSHATSWALGGGAVVAVAGAAVLFGLAMSTRAELSRGTPAGDVVQSELLGSQALEKNATANLELGLAAAAAGVGIGLGTAAVFTW